MGGRNSSVNSVLNPMCGRGGAAGLFNIPAGLRGKYRQVIAARTSEWSTGSSSSGGGEDKKSKVQEAEIEQLRAQIEQLRELRQCRKEEGVLMANSVETLGVDLRTRVKKSGAEEKAKRKKCKVRFSLIKKNKAFHKNYMQVVVKKLLRAGVVPARTWGVHAVGIAPTERLKLRRQMAAAAGKKSTTSLSLFLEAFGLEVEGALLTAATSLSLFMEAFGLEAEEELSTMATQTWTEGAWTGKWHTEQKEAWLSQIRKVQSDVGAGERACRSGDVGDP